MQNYFGAFIFGEFKPHNSSWFTDWLNYWRYLTEHWKANVGGKEKKSGGQTFYLCVYVCVAWPILYPGAFMFLLFYKQIWCCHKFVCRWSLSLSRCGLQCFVVRRTSEICCLCRAWFSFFLSSMAMAGKGDILDTGTCEALGPETAVACWLTVDVVWVMSIKFIQCQNSRPLISRFC